MRALALITGVVLIVILVLPICAPGQSNQGSKQDEAKKLLNQAFEATIQEENPEAREFALKKILSLEVSVGDGEQAMKRIEFVNDPMFVDGVVCGVATALALKGAGPSVFLNLQASGGLLAADRCSRDIAGALAQNGDGDGAVAFARREDDLLQRAIDLSDAAQTATEAGRSDTSKKIIDIALETARSIQDESKRVNALRIVAFAVEQDGKKSELSTILAEMESIVAKSDSTSEKDNLLSFLSETQAVAGDYGAANMTADLIQRQDLRDIAHVLISDRQRFVGDLDGAINSLRAVIDEEERLDWLAVTAGKVAERGNFAEAFNLVGEMSDQAQRNAAYALIAVGQSKHGEIQDAYRTARLITSDARRARTLIQIGASVPLPDKDHVADPIFSEAKSSALRIKEYYFRDAALSQLSGTLSARGEWALARDAEEAIDLDGAEDSARGNILKHKALALENIAYWQCMKGSCKEALDWADAERFPYLRGLALVGVVEAILGHQPPPDHNPEEGYGLE